MTSGCDNSTARGPATMAATTPATVIKERVFRSWDFPLFALLTLVNFVAMASLLAPWFSLDWRSSPAAFSVLTLLMLGVLSVHQCRWFLLPLMKRPKPMAARPGWRVGVATTFVPGAESLEMLEGTVKALVALDYPHDTWVLDEEDDNRVRALCRRLGARHFSRKDLPHYQAETGVFRSRSKHGNYNAWLYEIGVDRYDIISAFDPDHVPDPAFFSNVLGYFEDPRVGYVQAAQAYYNQGASFIARGAAEETYAFFSSMQMASFGMGYPIVIGSHNTHRVAALKQVGGFAPHDADDLMITLLYRDRGWQGVYVPRILARGLAPVDWGGYLIQQRRWARSVLDIKLKIYPKMTKNLRLGARAMGLLHGLNYLIKPILIFVSLVVLALALAMGFIPEDAIRSALPRFALAYAVLGLCDLYRQRFYLDPRGECGLHWRAALLHFAKWPYSLLALVEVALGRCLPYALTPKVKQGRRRHMLLAPNLLIIILFIVSWSVGLSTGHAASGIVGTITVSALALSAFLITSEYRKSPEPYDKSLSPRASLGVGRPGEVP